MEGAGITAVLPLSLGAEMEAVATGKALAVVGGRPESQPVVN